MRDINKQEPFSVNQNKVTKNAVPKTSNVLTGYIANSLNGGHNKVIAWKQIMAGEKHAAYRLKMNIQMLTPITPAYQNLRATIRAYFVPNSRVWDNAEKFTAQKGGATETKIDKVPNLGGLQLPYYKDKTDTNDIFVTGIYNTAYWRDSFISSYLPRMGDLFEATEGTENKPLNILPEINALPLRGRIAIYNDMERNKEYDEEIIEYKNDVVTQAELNSYLPYGYQNSKEIDLMTMRAKRQDSYYTDYRTELQGFDTEYPPTGTNNHDSALISWMNFEQLYSETKAQAENAQRNDWDIIAELRGSKVLTEGKVQKIAEKTFPINYSAITQNAYNNNEEIQEQFRVLGKQGAYSYTDIDMLLYSGVEFIEEGFLHIIMTVSADTVFESGIDRTLLNVGWQDQYRPDMINEKNDVLYRLELDTNVSTNSSFNQMKNEVIGFKRKYSEIFKLPNVIGGDMSNNEYFDYVVINELTEMLNDEYKSDQRILTNNTYQFFENSANLIEKGQGTNFTVAKKYWKDYTDFMINKNQAIQNTVVSEVGGSGIRGQNQIFFVGMQQCIAELPVDPAIAEGYLKWGEH